MTIISFKYRCVIVRSLIDDDELTYHLGTVCDEAGDTYTFLKDFYKL